MTTPNIPNAVQIHAAAFVTGATGAVGLGAANVTSVVRNGVGDYTVTLGTEIDPDTRSVQITLNDASGLRVCTVTGQTDAVFQVLTFNPGTEVVAPAAADVDFDFIVFRRSLDT